MNPAIILTVLKAVVGKNVKNDVEGDRPWFLSRRALGTGIASATGLLGMTGVSVPPEQVAEIVAAAGTFADIVSNNMGLWPAIWGAVLGVWGAIKA